jgi:hypothetical protein
VIISHDFYLTDAISGISKVTPSVAWDAVESVRSAIVTSDTLSPSEQVDYLELLKDALTQRICDFFEDMNYLDMRQHIVRLITWVLEDPRDNRHTLQLITALEKHGQPASCVTEDGEDTDPLGDEDFENTLYADNVAWRMLVDSTSRLQFPYELFDNEEPSSEEESGFQWRKFITSHKWIPQVLKEDRIFGTATFMQAITSKEGVYQTLTFPLHEYSVLTYELNPDSCASLILHETGVDGYGAATIIPRSGLTMKVGVDRASTTSLINNGLRIENAMLGLTAFDVDGVDIYENPLYESNATIELMDDGSVNLLTAPSTWPL